MQPGSLQSTPLVTSDLFLLHFIGQSACLTPGRMAVTSQFLHPFLLTSGCETMLPYVRLAGIACWCLNRWSVKSPLSFPLFSGHVLPPGHIGKDEWCGSVSGDRQRRQKCLGKKWKARQKTTIQNHCKWLESWHLPKVKCRINTPNCWL